ncbi:MAG: lytic transglycosylase domain-containing protein [Granulosicoccus sp.]
MTLLSRQKTGSVDSACVLMLCMATTMLLGFSNPKNLQASIESAEEPLEVAVSVVEEDNMRLKAPVPSTPAVSSSVPLIRPASFAGKQQLEFVLGSVRSRKWIPYWVYSPDRVIDEQRASMVGTFHGVGFPDIRTHQRKKRSPFDAPGPWAPLVTWRTGQSAQSGSEPIARVRCMGLTPQAVARRADRYRDMIYAYADEYDVSRHLVKAVITEESCFNNKALSPVGAQGLMQLMPDTASWLKVKDPHDPAQNVRAGVRYLASLQRQFETVELALAAYNAGPGNVRRYKGVPPFAETRAYVVNVQAHYRRYLAAHSMVNPADDGMERASNTTFQP